MFFIVYLQMVRNHLYAFLLRNKCRKHFGSMSYVYSIQRQERLGFNESIIDTGTTRDELVLSVKQIGDTVAIDSNDSDALSLPIRRPSYCPFAARNRVVRSHIPPGVRPPGREHIPVASACLLESPDRESLLLTQRPWHMRTYPGLWVPPGGHSEPGELIQTTALRELCEEIGVTSAVPEKWISQMSVALKPLCAWEAAYPAVEAPRSHHLVLYYVVPWPSWLCPHTNLPLPSIEPPLDEVQSVVWLPRSVLTVLNQDWLQFDAFWCEKLQAISTGQDHTRLLAPDPAPVNELRTPVWVWDVQVSRWEQKPVNQLIRSLSSPETCDLCQLVAPEPSETRSSSLSVGTLYAIGKWLSNH